MYIYICKYNIYTHIYLRIYIYLYIHNKRGVLLRVPLMHVDRKNKKKKTHLLKTTERLRVRARWRGALSRDHTYS